MTLEIAVILRDEKNKKLTRRSGTTLIGDVVRYLLRLIVRLPLRFIRDLLSIGCRPKNFINIYSSSDLRHQG